MSHLASVLIAADGADFAAALLERLGRGGYQGRSVASGATALAQARHDQPDILIIGPGLSDMDPLALGTAVKRDDACGNVPVVLIGAAPTPDLAQRAFEAGIDDVLADAFDMVPLVARIRPLLRISTMHAELRHRSAVSRQFGIEPPPSPGADPAAKPAVLLVGDERGDLGSLIADEADLTVSGNLFEAEDLLSERNFDAAVAVTGTSVDDVLNFCSQVRNNPRLFNLPVLLVDAGGAGLDIVDAYRRGASRVLRTPLDPVQLRCAVLSLVRRQQLRWSIRRALGQMLSGPARDVVTGTYSSDFLVRYLGHRLAAAKSLQRHLSVLFFYVPSVDAVRQQFGDEPAHHLLVQLGQWIGGLLRGEDVTARYQGNEFCVVLPDTPLEEADVVMHRIAGVLSYTDFAVKDVYQPVKVWVQVGSAAAAPDDTVETLVARARAKLD